MPRLRGADGFRQRAAAVCLDPLRPGLLLLVGSSKAGFGARLVLPAGGVDATDTSAAAAARREAREEAGVEGVALGLGGAGDADCGAPLCVITDTAKMAVTRVFVLLVTRELGFGVGDACTRESGLEVEVEHEDVVEAMGRGRAWVAVADAEARLGGKPAQVACLRGALSSLRHVVAASAAALGDLAESHGDSSDAALLASGLAALRDERPAVRAALAKLASSNAAV